jgi:hypothetical protein
MKAYCLKCKAQREMVDPKDVVYKNGRNAIQGKCPVCGGKLSRMVPSKKK